MRVKICGITTSEDARSAAGAGADVIGLNFVGGPRRIDPDRAREILGALPPLIVPVALYEMVGGRPDDELLQRLADLRITHVQLYGHIDAVSIAELAERGFRAIPVLKVADDGFASQADPWLLPDAQHLPAAILLDAHDPTQHGGTGRPFPWDWVASARDAGRLAGWPPIILAGGLRPDNVADAVRVVRPFAVDVSSGVEIEGTPGRKDSAKMREFVANAKAAAITD